jgi:hypothetical protein
MLGSWAVKKASGGSGLQADLRANDGMRRTMRAMLHEAGSERMLFEALCAMEKYWEARLKVRCGARG